jgi:2-oxoglutarate ferredoxin oxidoreductase subunit gamma
VADTHEIKAVLAGFGGQGILFAGKLLAYFGLLDEKEVSWLPSYGPAMRGGTCNCSVTVSDKPVGSPLITEPNVLFVMNTPSYDKFIATVEAGGTAFIDETLVSAENIRGDIKSFFVPATALATEHGLKGAANIILLGKFLKEVPFTSKDTVRKALEKNTPAKKPQMFESNLKAFDIGYNFI